MEDELEPENEPQESPDIRQLRKKAKLADEAEARANAAERKLAIIQAGVDINSPTGKLFLKAYDGDNDTDSIQTAAQEYGVIKAPEPEVPAEELKTLERMANASAGAEHVGKTNPVDEIKSAQSPEEVIAAYEKAGGRIAGGE